MMKRKGKETFMLVARAGEGKGMTRDRMSHASNLDPQPLGYTFLWLKAVSGQGYKRGTEKA